MRSGKGRSLFRGALDDQRVLGEAGVARMHENPMGPLPSVEPPFLAACEAFERTAFAR